MPGFALCGVLGVGRCGGGTGSRSAAATRPGWRGTDGHRRRRACRRRTGRRRLGPDLDDVGVDEAPARPLNPGIGVRSPQIPDDLVDGLLARLLQGALGRGSPTSAVGRQEPDPVEILLLGDHRLGQTERFRSALAQDGAGLRANLVRGGEVNRLRPTRGRLEVGGGLHRGAEHRQDQALGIGHPGEQRVEEFFPGSRLLARFEIIAVHELDRGLQHGAAFVHHQRGDNLAAHLLAERGGRSGPELLREGVAQLAAELRHHDVHQAGDALLGPVDLVAHRDLGGDQQGLCAQGLGGGDGSRGLRHGDAAQPAQSHQGHVRRELDRFELRDGVFGPFDILFLPGDQRAHRPIGILFGEFEVVGGPREHIGLQHFVDLVRTLLALVDDLLNLVARVAVERVGRRGVRSPEEVGVR